MQVQSVKMRRRVEGRQNIICRQNNMYIYIHAHVGRSTFVLHTNVYTSFHIYKSWLLFHCIYVLHLLYPVFCGHLGCFHVLAIVKSDAMNTGVHVCFWIMVFSGYMPRSGIAGLYHNSIFSFFEEAPYCIS